MMNIEDYKAKISKKTCNAKELAEIIGISEAKARQLMRIQGFPVLRIGRNKRVLLSCLDKWLEEHIGEVL